MTVSTEVIVVARALRQAFETESASGTSINVHPNPGFLVLTGAFNIERAAQIVYDALMTHIKNAEAAAKKAEEKLIADAKAEVAKLPA